MTAERPVGQLWELFLARLAANWEQLGFNQVQTTTGIGFARQLNETNQLVHYEIGSSTPEQVVFSVNLGVWSHRLTKLNEKTAHRLNARKGHWYNNLINLMPPASGHQWWTVRLEALDTDIKSHAQLMNATILPILDALACDLDLVKAWRSGSPLSGLTPFPSRAANAVRLAQEVGGSDEAASVARDMAAMSAAAGSDRSAAIAKLREVAKLLEIEDQLFLAPSDTDLN